jgi:hypothetical protein
VFIYILGAVLIAVIALVVGRTLYKGRRDRQRLERQLTEGEVERERKRLAELDLINRAENGDHEAIQGVIDRLHGFNPGLFSEHRDRALAVEAAKEYRGPEMERLRTLLRQSREATGVEERLEAVRELLSRLKDSRRLSGKNRERFLVEGGTTKKRLLDQLQGLVQERYAELLPRAEEDRETFLALRDLIDRTRTSFRWGHEHGRPKSGDLREISFYHTDWEIKELQRPEGWNGWVARFIANPFLYDFEDLADPKYGELELWTAEALRTEDLALAKIVRAYCHDGQLAGQVASELRAELAQFVEQRNFELGLAGEVELKVED